MINSAMIMAAGLGTRMRPLTDDRPKPLVTVGGRALIDHALDRLVDAGVGMAVINLHYKAQMLRDHLDRRRDIDIRYSLESDALLGTGGGVARALPQFGGEAFFVLNSDTIWMEHGAPVLPRMIKEWDTTRMDGLLLLADRATALGYDGRGDFVKNTAGHLGRVPSGATSPFAYPGVQIIHSRLFADSPKGEFSTNLMWDRAIATGRLYGTVLDGKWIHVGDPAARAEADALLAQA